MKEQVDYNIVRSICRALTLTALFDILVRDVTATSVAQLEILKPDDDFNMRCQPDLERFSRSILVWGKDSQYGESIIPQASAVQDDDRIKIQPEGLQTYRLTISNLMASDEADYSCAYLHLNDDWQDPYSCATLTVFNVVSLRILRPAEILDNSTMSKLVKEGETVEMTCYVSGYPEPVVSWKRDNEMELPTGNYRYPYPTLQFTASLENAGIYKCVAFNGVGESVFRTISIIVKPETNYD